MKRQRPTVPAASGVGEPKTDPTNKVPVVAEPTSGKVVPDTPAPVAGASPQGSSGLEGRSAVDVWVERGLRRLYGGVVNEPIPEEWLKLIEADRKPK